MEVSYEHVANSAIAKAQELLSRLIMAEAAVAQLRAERDALAAQIAAMETAQ